VNAAGYISGKFQDALKNRGWEKEPSLEGQNIDGYIELNTRETYSLKKSHVVNLTSTFWDENPTREFDEIVSLFYGMFVKRNCFTLGTVPETYHEHFMRSEKGVLRIGLEFETGNIASSFRALSKLGSLYQNTVIDAAVFITSVDKNSTAARIWPTSNRNGSFEELDKRDYLRNVRIPLWEFSFAPDAVSKDAPYLSKDGSTYRPTPTDFARVKVTRARAAVS